MASTGQAWAKGSLQPTGLPVIGTTRRPDCLSRAMASTTWSGTTPSVVRVSSMSVRMPSGDAGGVQRDRKSTRLNSSHANISYAVFCLKKKKKKHKYLTEISDSNGTEYLD